MKAKRKYGIITHVWNPVKGVCQWQCTYCYSRISQLRHGWIGMDKEEFNSNLEGKNFRHILISSNTDLFQPNIDVLHFERKAIIEKIAQVKNAFFYFQTKSIDGYLRYNYPENSMLLTTIESNLNHNVSRAEHPIIRFAKLKNVVRKGIIIQPILDFNQNFVILIKNANPEFIWIGRYKSILDMNVDLPLPKDDKVFSLVGFLIENNIDVKLDDYYSNLFYRNGRGK